MPSPYIAFCPATRRVFGVGRTPTEARDDAEFHAGVVTGATPPWRSLDTRPCTEQQARAVEASNGPASLDDVERAA